DSKVIDAKMVQQRSSYSRSLKQMLEKKVEEARHKEELRVSQLRQVQAERSKAEERTRLQAEAELARKQAEALAIEEQRRKLAEQVRSISIEPVNGSADASEEGDDGQHKEKKPRGKKRKSEDVARSPGKRSTLSRDYISSSDEDTDAPDIDSAPKGE